LVKLSLCYLKIQYGFPFDEFKLGCTKCSGFLPVNFYDKQEGKSQFPCYWHMAVPCSDIPVFKYLDSAIVDLVNMLFRYIETAKRVALIWTVKSR